MTRFADRLSLIEPFHVVDVLTRAKKLASAGQDIVHMEAGEPDFPTIAPIREAAKKALDQGATYYTDALGVMALRESISEFYKQRFNVDVPARRIVITPGASGALQLCTLLLLNAGDGMMLTDPGYPCNRQFIRMAGGEAQLVPVDARDNYQFTAAKIQTHWQPNTVGAMVASPSNPTGSALSKAALTEVFKTVERKGGTLIVDELYQNVAFGESTASILSITDKAFVVNSFSKFFGMTGWRLGWMVVPDDAVEWVEKLSQNLFISLSTPAQYGAIAGFTEPSLALLEERRALFQQRCEFLLPALRDIGFGIPNNPEGAFYLYANCEKFTENSLDFCRLLLEETGVAVTPGCDFGVHKADQHVRFSFTTSMTQLEKGVERLANFLR